MGRHRHEISRRRGRNHGRLPVQRYYLRNDLEISNQEKPQEQQEKIVDDKPTTTVTDDTVETVGPESDDKTLSPEERDIINAALKTADTAISEQRYQDALAISGPNAKDNAILAERLTAKLQQIGDAQRWRDRAQDAPNWPYVKKMTQLFKPLSIMPMVMRPFLLLPKKLDKISP